MLNQGSGFPVARGQPKDRRASQSHIMVGPVSMWYMGTHYIVHTGDRCACVCTIATRLLLVFNRTCSTGIVIHKCVHCDCEQNIILNSSFHLLFLDEYKNVDIWYWGSPPPPLRNKS